MYTLTLTKDQLNVIASALGQGPFNVVAPVINELQRQVTEQEQAAAAKAAEVTKEAA